MSNHVYELVISSSNQGQFCQNVMHWRFDDGAFTDRVSAASALIDAWLTAGKTAWRGCLPASTLLLSAKARCVDDAGGFEAVVPITANRAGTRAGDGTAAGVAPVIIFYPLDNARVRGKLFLPGLSVDDAQDGVLSNLWKTQVDAHVDTFTDDIVLTGGGAPTATFGIYNRKTKVFHAGVIHQPSDIIGVQRRRQRPA